MTREELRKRLWGGDTFVDFEHGLNAAVNKLRQALGDSATNPRWIETIPGKGYRFIGSVEPAAKRIDVSSQAERITLLAASDELPIAPRPLVRVLLLALQLMYMAFYLAALANLPHIEAILVDAQILSPVFLLTVLILTAVGMIPVRLFITTAVLFRYEHLWTKFARIFPVLLVIDLLWALSPLLLAHRISPGLALGLSAALVYAPFAQRSLVLMYTRR